MFSPFSHIYPCTSVLISGLIESVLVAALPRRVLRGFIVFLVAAKGRAVVLSVLCVFVVNFFLPLLVRHLILSISLTTELE